MLPSTGYFKTINCPFYESGTCDRPYCHFKHSKREDAGIATESTETVENRSVGQPRETKATDVQSDSDVLQQLVTEAVKKVLADRDVTDTDKLSCRNVVSRVVEGLKPSLTSGSSDTLDIVATNSVENRTDATTPINKPVPCVYNPTPIAELKKRHIPIISYMPTRESKVAVKRKCSPDRIKPWLVGVGCESNEAQTTEIKYKPTTIINSESRDTNQSYIPTCRSDSISSNSYEEDSANEYLLKLKEVYYPKCKKRREEYVPKKVKAPLKTVENLNESTLTRFKPRFDITDEVSTDIKRISNVQPSEESFRSCLDIEPKFSDDDNDDDNDNDNDNDDDNGDGDDDDDNNDDNNDDNDNDDDDNNDENDNDSRGHDIEDHDRNVSESNAEFVTQNTSQRDVRKDDSVNGVVEGTREHSPKVNVNDALFEENRNKELSRDNNVSTQGQPTAKEASKTVDADKDKAVNKRAKEYENRDKSKNRDRKSEDSSRKSCKERRVSNEKSRSAFRSKKSRDKSRSRRESKDSKNDGKGRVDKDKSRDKHQEEKRWNKERSRGRSESSRRKSSSKRDKKDKKDHRESDKHREHDSKNPSESSRRQNYSGKRNNDKSKQSKLNDKSDDEAIERQARNSEERTPTNESARSLVSVRANLDDDDNDNDHASDDSDEENDDRHGNIVDDVDDSDHDVILSATDSDRDVQEECLKIFQEYQAPKRSKTVVVSPKESTSILEKEQIEDTGKKRIAHPSATTCIGRQITVNQQLKKSINPQQKMYERWRLMRDTVVTEKTVSGSSSTGQDILRRNRVEGTAGMACNKELKLNGNGRVRIAHVPYAKSLAIEKKKMTENASKSTETTKVTDNCKTAAQTAKSGVRVAHVPQTIPQLIRPEPLQVATQKFPLNVRQYYVNMMHDVCVQIYTNAEDAAQRAIKEEYACHERCKALTVYKNSCMLATHRLRKEVDQNPSIESNLATMSYNSVVSHEAVLAGKVKGSWSVLKTKKSVTQFRGATLYNMLKKWIMTEEQLRDNGFPRVHPGGQKGRAKIYVINSRNQSVLSKVPNERICSRCGQTYTIDKQGLPVRQQNCIYHWGRKITIRGEGKYTCCQQYGSASGCCDAKAHVWDYTDYENLRGYVKTLPKDTTTVEEQGVYALDCEMSYTTQGLELTRITVVDEDCSVVYETLVKPQNPVIDYNTRFSGITEESMKDVTSTLLDVQAALLTMFSEKTILVGHSLESDFKALRLFHDTVVDTSVMFPHKNGYPQKRALKNLCSEYLRKIIQNDVGGHDSKEDAVACMELILWKAKEEAKLQ